MQYSLEHDASGALLFDFTAAFPSILHDFLHGVLEGLGLPPAALQVVRTLYAGHCCEVSFAGERFPGFQITAGVRQGCPLSPLLFAAVLDPFLRHLAASVPGAAVYAYADDIAMVLQHIERDMPRVHACFEEFAAVSGLRLNLPKVVCIPLWHEDLGRVRQRMEACCPPWAGIVIRGCARYLGFWVGPDKAQKSWQQAGERMMRRARAWPWNRLGLQYSARAYNCYVASAAAFVGQLERVPEAFRAIEDAVLRLAAPGPYRWASRTDLFHLASSYGQASSFACIEVIAVASQARVAHQEARAAGGLQILRRAAALDRRLAATDYVGRRVLWGHWYSDSHLFVLREALSHCSRAGAAPHDVEAALSGGEPRPWPRHVDLRARGRLQGEIRRRLLAGVAPNAVERCRHKLRRWRLDGLPAVVARRVAMRFQELVPLAPPRVRAAVLSTLWNRWTTHRRFQQRGAAGDYCLLCCGGAGASDSLEHYGRCKVVWTVAERALRLPGPGSPGAWARFLLAAPDLDPAGAPDALCRVALLVYATYTVVNMARQQAPFGHAAVAADALEHTLREAARGHDKASRVLSRILG